MRLHPVISILLAAWFVLGSTLGPRYLCSCADGSVTVEYGQQFCCDSDESCCDDSCDDRSPAEEDLGLQTFDVLSCIDGCNSTLLTSNAAVTIDRADEDQSWSSTESTALPSYSLFESQNYQTMHGADGRARMQACYATETSKLRTVILLV